MTTAYERREIDHRCLELRLAGLSYQRIADQVGISKPGAYKATQRALRTHGELVDPDLLGTASARLDAMLTGLWARARSGNIAAIDRVLKIEEARRDLLDWEARRGELKKREKRTGGEFGHGRETGLVDFERRLAERQARRGAGS